MRILALFFLFGSLLIQISPKLPSQIMITILLCLSLLMTLLLRERFNFKLKIIKYLSFILPAALAGLFLSGFVAQQQLNKRLPNHLEGKDVVLIGKINDIPDVRKDGVRFQFKIKQSFLADDIETPVNIIGIARLGWFKNIKPINAGEVWQLRVRLKRPSGFLNPGGFDYEKWLFTQRITATGYVRANKDAYLEQIERLSESPWWSINRLRQNIHAKIQHLVQNESSASVLSALLVAVRSKLNDEQWKQLQQTGTSHLIAISGLHIAVVAGFAFLPILLIWRLFPRLNERIPLRVAGGIAGVLFACAYALLAGFTLPTQRALLMVIIALLGLISRRNFHVSNILATAMIGVLILDPLAPMTASFWLSFLSVSLILIFVKRQITQPNYQLIKLQLVLSLGMLPLTLFFFNTVSLTSPIANLFAIPWVSLIVVPLGLLAVIIMPLSSFISGALLNIASLAISWLFTALSYLSDSSIGTFTLAEIPGRYLLIAFLGLLFMLLPKGFPARWLGVIAFLPTLLFSVQKPPADTFTFTLLDVGQGMASVIQTENHLLIYDTGTKLSDTFDIGKLVLIPYLKSKGVTQIDNLIISHEDNDHRGGAKSLLKEIPAIKILSSDTSILEKYEVEACQQGMKWQWDGIDFKILSPSEDYLENDNNRSCVLRVSNQHHSLLLTGDIELKTEKRLLESSMNELDVDILSVPHHGSKTSSSDEFIRATSPQMGLIPFGYRNRFGHPKEEVVKRYQKNAVTLLDTVTQGAIRMVFPNSDKPIRINSYRAEKKGFWSR